MDASVRPLDSRQNVAITPVAMVSGLAGLTGLGERGFIALLIMALMRHELLRGITKGFGSSRAGFRSAYHLRAAWRAPPAPKLASVFDSVLSVRGVMQVD